MQSDIHRQGLNEMVVLVDEQGVELGTMNKLEAHQKGILHSAFSVFIFNSQHQVLLHRRAQGKYHSGGLWTNACCSHPNLGEPVEDAAAKRLQHEMGITCTLEPLFIFCYKADVGNDLTEHERDHVFLGITDAIPHPNPAEVQQWKWAAPRDVSHEMEKEPEKYSAWFKIAFPKVMEIYRSRKMK